MNSIVLLTFLAVTGAIAFVSWIKSRKEKLNTITALFFANRKLGFLAVGFGLLFANINTAMFIGENELAYTNNMSVMAWGLTSVFAMLLVAEFIMPIYLRHGISTTPEYLGIRYDHQTKTIVTVIFLANYLVNFLPAVLYSGAVALNGIFGISENFKLGYWTTIWILVWCLGIVGVLYSLLGGQKAITISDTLLGFAMFTAGLLLPYFGLKELGEGDWIAGLQKILSTNTGHLNSIGRAGDAVPFSTIFTGMFLVNLYYWGTEQYIVQQVLGSRDLASCQKGIALACGGKILCVLLVNIPGIIAVHLYKDLPNSSEVFPTFLSGVAPPVYTGLMAALLFGAAFTSFNAGLSGSSTLFILNIYKPWAEKRNPGVTEKTLVRTAKRFEMFICLSAMIVAPFLLFASQGFYQHVQKISALFTVPIFTILAAGLLTRRVPALAAKTGLFFFIFCYGISQFIVDLEMHFLHVIAILFIATFFLMLAIGKWKPMTVPYEPKRTGSLNMSPWKNRHLVSVVLLTVVVVLYVIFSPLVLVK
ncbi:solute:sodium symporter family transporter [Flavihumibacter profundi]|jgi:solute:Na+ symporter, SSS family|uniref:solute:sodium symporter family transporter n=1 Tax=Flavihumibacter profundi TaxID=2716883 RepID=UPI001CC7A4CE|nr:solute:sodium symporter family transporter [Flavihumibacter profundi]MBZ5855524.1 solute:sodium symporter family transporter [Flavihumibacter profundi]